MLGAAPTAGGDRDHVQSISHQRRWSPVPCPCELVHMCIIFLYRWNKEHFSPLLSALFSLITTLKADISLCEQLTSALLVSLPLRERKRINVFGRQIAFFQPPSWGVLSFPSCYEKISRQMQTLRLAAPWSILYTCNSADVLVCICLCVCMYIYKNIYIWRNQTAKNIDL